MNFSGSSLAWAILFFNNNGHKPVSQQQHRQSQCFYMCRRARRKDFAAEYHFSAVLCAHMTKKPLNISGVVAAKDFPLAADAVRSGRTRRRVVKMKRSAVLCAPVVK
jgi:hypothetical protein